MTSESAGTAQSAWFIGEGSLLIQAAETWLSKGHRITGVASRLPAIDTWARERGIAVVDPGALAAALSNEPFDYLFSIVNLTMLEEALLSVPRKLAVNFHDGPLPRYAGVNAPVWALLAGETTYGVTFHEMTREADTGRILVQQFFDIAPEETAFSLNAKCFNAGIEAFRELTQQISDGTLEPRAQDLSLRAYFDFYDRPPGAQVLSFAEPGEKVVRTVRALDFGTYPNPVGMPKIPSLKGPVLVTEARALERTSDRPAGTVVAVEPDALVVATSTVDVRLAGLRGDCGSPLGDAALAERGLSPGTVLAAPTAALHERLGHAAGESARHEGYFLRVLSTLSPLDVDLGAKGPGEGALDVAVTAPPSIPGDALAAWVLAFLARCTGQFAYDVAFADPALRERTEGVTGLFSTAVPLRVRVAEAASVAEATAALSEAQKKVSSRFPPSRDLFVRQPAARRNALSVAVLVDVDWEPGPLADPDLRIRIGAADRIIRLLAPAGRLSAETLSSLGARLSLFLRNASQSPERLLRAVPLVTEDETARLADFNRTARLVEETCLHTLFEAQARRTPDRVAVTSRGTSLTYRELDQRANALAELLRARGVGPDTLVGVFLERSVHLMVAVLGIHKAGGAYVPLDPDYPADRIRFMIEDAGLSFVVTDHASTGSAPPGTFESIVVDTPELASGVDTAPAVGVTPRNLAYAIYTSGSTGKPKGVLIEHQSVVNFLAGMDEIFATAEGGTWLAVTSLSFDISVLELFGALTRGLHLVIASADGAGAAARPLTFSLFYFSANSSGGGPEHYRLLLDGARFADENGFCAVWTPERHFHQFGGLYPNPAVAGAALAAVTKRVGIRAGSCVSPLHSPIRIAEEWSLVDNLSGGRVGISFASGWQPNDFALRPENFKGRKEQMFRDIEAVRRLWRGEALEFPNGVGKPVSVRTLPRPVQGELPVWVTAAGNPETFEAAGRAGANVLTHLLGQTFKDIEEKTRVYREARKKAGHAGEGTVTLMLHTFLGPDEAEVKRIVREPMKEYLRTAMELIKEAAWSFPTFKEKSMLSDGSFAPDQLSPEEFDAVLEHAFERYYESSGFFGDEAAALRTIETVRAAGVDEIACLIDFGVATDEVLASLPYLAAVMKKATPVQDAAHREPLGELFQKHGVTHFQCTPSMASMLLLEDQTRAGLSALRSMLVGGEALPPSLAQELASTVGGSLFNMYGPTETTIWSSYQKLSKAGADIPIGRPIANTDILILDRCGGLLPPGQAGELAIGGHGLARGYHRRKELTEERFVPHPLHPRERIYRTGDLALFDPEGVLHFKGRLDHQVKVRGYRIELGEIEARLGEHPAVRECAVIVREDVPGDKRLVAYLVPDGQAPQAAALRAHLADQLPDYMVPAAFVTLRALPQTPNRKIDRKALPRPDQGGNGAPAASSGPKEAPSDELEQMLAGIWCEVLGRPEVSVNDNFFDLGGHSLLTIRVLGQLKPKVERPLSLVDLFRYPTIRSLSDYLRSSATNDVALDQSAARGAERMRIRRAMMDRRRG